MANPYDSPANVARYSGVQRSKRRSTRPSSAEAHRQLNAPIRPEHVPGVRRVLRAHGYDVDAKGPLTQRLLSAWKNYRRTVHYGTGGRGTGDNAQPGGVAPETWNAHNQRAHGGGKPPLGPHGARSEMVGSPQHFRDAVNRKVDHPHVNPTVKAHNQAKTKVKARVSAQQLGATGVKGGGNFPGADTNVILPRSMADNLAGAQFDPQIREARLQQLRQGRDQAQAERDIGSWFGQVQAAQKAAAGQDTAAGSRARADVSALVNSVQGLLGGSRGAGVVGAAGVNDLAALAGQGQAQDSFNAEMAPILAGERSSDLSRQRALGSQAQEKLASQLVDLQGQRGQAKAAALMQIIQANNQSRQGNFANRLALNNAALAAQSLGLDAAKTNAQLQQYGLENKMRQAQLAAAQKASSPHADWGALNTFDRQKVIDNAIKNAVAELPAGVWDPEHVRNAALAHMRAGGYLSARKGSFKGRVPNARNQQSILGFLNAGINRYGMSQNKTAQ